MSVKIVGLEDVLKNLDAKFSPDKVERVKNKALRAGAKAFENELLMGLSSYSDTGATMAEVVISSPKGVGSVKVVRIGWNGPKKRYKLVHLNEFGYTRYGKKYSPAGYGVIRTTIDKTEETYKQVVKDSIVEELL